MELNLKGDITAATKHLKKLQRKQIPFATSLAMNQTVLDIQAEEKRRIKTDLDRPTPGTVNAIRVFRSSKRRLEAGVFILRHVSAFLRYQIEGGTRRPRGRVEAIPRDIRLGKYGNIPGRRQGKLKKLLQKPDYFQGTVGGISGIWRRLRKGGVSLIVEYSTRSLKYSRRYPFYRIAEYTAARTFPRNLTKAIARAIK